MIIWAPDFRFIWSPRNFDVVRRGGELPVGWRRARNLRAERQRDLQRRHLRHPRVARRCTIGRASPTTPPWSGRPGRGPPTCAGTGSASAFPTARAPTRARPSRSWTLGLERRLGAGLGLRGEVRDLTDRRAEFLAGYPTPGRSVLAHSHRGGSMMRRHSFAALAVTALVVTAWRSAAPTRTRRFPIRRRSCWR